MIPRTEETKTIIGKLAIAHANQWLGSLTYCRNNNLDPARYWAASTPNGEGCWIEPTIAFKRVTDLINYHRDLEG